MSATDEWRKLRTACFRRDKYTCRRCEKVNNQGRGLSAHHIIPRSDGGIDDISNLITLCTICHDFVEVNNLRSWAAIEGSYDSQLNMPQEKTIEKNSEGYYFERPTWHKWVYGGTKNRDG